MNFNGMHIADQNILVIDTITFRHRLRFFLGYPLAFKVDKRYKGKLKRYAVVIGRKK